MNSANPKVFAWQPMLAVGVLSLLLLLTLQPCGDLFAAGLTPEQTELGSAPTNSGREVVGPGTSQGGLSNCCHRMLTSHDIIQAAPLVVDYRSPQLDSVVLAASISAQQIVKPISDWPHAYNAPTLSIPLYLRFKQLLI